MTAGAADLVWTGRPEAVRAGQDRRAGARLGRFTPEQIAGRPPAGAVRRRLARWCW